MLPTTSKINEIEQTHEIVHDILNEISLEALSLANDLNNRINKYVPFKYHHISVMLNETLGTNINPSTLENLLNFISSRKLTDNYVKFYHDLNVELILSSYSLNKSLSNKYAELCSPILLVPFCDVCPKYHLVFRS
jgi:hypothetical protein